MSKISIIYGKNGQGKSKYYNEMKTKSNCRCLNYDIEGWYFEKDKKLSQEKFVNKKLNELKDEKFNKFFYKNKELFGKAKKSQIQNFLEENNLLDLQNWINLKNISDSKHNFKKIEDFLDIWEIFFKHKNIISDLDEDTFEILKIYCNLEYEEIENLNLKKSIFYQEKIINISDEIREILLKKIDKKLLENFKKIHPIDLDRIRSKEITKEIFLDEFKNTVLNNKDFQEIIEIKNEIEKNKLDCLKFTSNIHLFDSKIKIDDDGYTLSNVDLSQEKYSAGQKAMVILCFLLDCFKNESNLIILDDIFEKLDIENLTDVIRKNIYIYSSNKNFNIEILTHDINVVNLIKNILSEFEHISLKDICFYEMDFDIKKPMNNCTNFNEYLKEIFKKLESKKEAESIKLHFFFSKLFYRNKSLINFSQTNEKLKNINKENIENSIQATNYNFLSENIFHYEKNVNLDKIPDFKEYLILNNKINEGEIVDTVRIYEILIELFSNSDSCNIGISLIDVADYLKKMLFFIKKEKEHFLKNEIGNQKKHNFYSKINLSEEEKNIRNKLFHNLEYSLTFLEKKDNKKY